LGSFTPRKDAINMQVALPAVFVGDNVEQVKF
jgi:hypothetical protein